jgi:hypothetical protein
MKIEEDHIKENENVIDKIWISQVEEKHQ